MFITIFRSLRTAYLSFGESRIVGFGFRIRGVGLSILSDSASDRIGILCSDSDSDFGLNPSDRIDEKLISDPTGNTILETVKKKY